MISRFRLLFRLAGTYLLLFWSARVLFVAYNHSLFPPFSFKGVFALVKNSFLLDVSTICYLLIIPFIISLLPFSFNRFKKGLLQVYVVLSISVLAVIEVANVLLYSEWFTKLNVKAISFLANPSEVIRTASSGQLLLFAMFCIALAYFTWLVSRSKKTSELITQKTSLISYLFYALGAPALIFLGMRGGLAPIPINLSQAYFSKKQVINDLAVNTSWNLIQSISENVYSFEENPFQAASFEESQNVANQLFHTKQDSTIQILKTPHPNVVLIIVESLSAELIASCNGESPICNQFDSLSKQGVLFTQVYSTGWRSDMGIPALLSAFPTQPSFSVVTQPAKYDSLPMLGKKMSDLGYFTSFAFGGQLSYGNIKSYVYANGFNRIIEEESLGNKYPKGKLGVHDEFLYQEEIEQLNWQKQAFFSVIYTLSSHPPYDMPMKEEKIHFGDEDKPYLNSVYYAEECLGNFIKDAQKTDWYANTLFVITADHGHSTPGVKDHASFKMRHIPLLFFGEVIKDEMRGRRMDEIASQNDFAATLLSQIGQKSDEFFWSRNILAQPFNQFAYGIFYKGFAWKSPEGEFAYDFNFEHLNYKNYPNDSLFQRDWQNANRFFYHHFVEYERY